ncbi:magnesium transporter CorA [Enterococcus sp. JM4C]|uniref:magnesium transporter CorA family protein n=1 Tax=Candidatus Enterococcus huntleyi TaxID=1857217 RepID=UPI00137AE51D|nr:magnesium transporter CorA family protein [Enterococcus sp. JM4C]KAF1297145.1 magnesium transporter CorA [Enterococcus sp. JM4C]
MINYYSLENEYFKNQASDEKNVFWVYAEAPTKEEVALLTKKYKMPADYITSILDDSENSRSEELEQVHFEHPALLLLQYPYAITSPSGYLQITTLPFSVIVTPEKKIITVTNHTPVFMQEVISRKYPRNDMSHSMNLLLQLIWELSLSYNHYLQLLKTQSDKLEGELQVSTENSQLYQIMDIQKSLIYVETATSANLETLSKLNRTQTFTSSHAYKIHLHDVLVETKQALSSSQIQLKIVNQMTQTFSAIVSNNLNNVMKILTSLTIVLTIPTIIGGLYGMNVKLPFAGRSDAFFWLCLLTIFLCTGTIYYLKKKHLL